ncbi:S1/P1 nuclease [Bradyrhizobium diazoefficiens]|nr:S1/P1 nuclease [Bradyrhizobium diazoefficiens]MBR0966987.1 S1/P1 nuclease [Bradyrhizobium diazoefficiens]MBR0979111.1 S1/P1 nuclease [Bradyrhizobium diazoefficiens]MBR1009970.1 S1/P1 nuclease [Bradyrhizobium diazoefficiens]MBR1016548.1 S1/P1 nuclease [Bradyrhizobium diazoefficiens]MBR1053808.1 S1/P1 nuclease [Bradyrhizobium diazoefficiens]
MRAIVVAALSLVALCGPAQAWWDEGHMQIAYIAYNKLTPAVKDRVDTLLKLNPDYGQWTAGAPAGIEKTYAFVHAATWADDIKEKPNYHNGDVTDADAGQNVGYTDRSKHDYWHYKDILFSPDGTHMPPPPPVDAVTQLKKMIDILPSTSGATDDLRSYDLVWMLHLVGDLHQPLHAVARYTAQISGANGDRGGNEEHVIPATGETIALHAYWDRIFGGYASVFGAIYDATHGGISSITPDDAKAKILDPEVWAQESFELARQNSYAAPIRVDKTAVELTRDYETNARTIARSQAALGAARLANLLNMALQ